MDRYHHKMFCKCSLRERQTTNNMSRWRIQRLNNITTAAHFIVGKTTMDSREEMNHEVFESRFFQVPLKSTPAGSTIVMDKASYHCRVPYKAPTSASRNREKWKNGS